MSGISTQKASEFHNYFNQQRQEVLDKLDSNPLVNDLSELSRKISSIRLEINQISSLLPVHDRVKYEKQLSELETRISLLKKSNVDDRSIDQSKTKTKSKFSFNKSKNLQPASASASASASGSTSTSKPAIIPDSSKLKLDAEESLTIGATTSTSVANEKIDTSSSSSSHMNIHTISNLSNQLIRPPRDVQGTYTLSLSNLTDCIIDLRSSPSSSPGNYSILNAEEERPKLTALHVKSLKRCVLISPIIKGSALLDEVVNSILVLGCQQFRIHSSSNTSILLNVNSLPIIEHSNKLKFGLYPDVLISVSDGNTNQDNHTKVQDFDWPLPTPSPNWSLIPEERSQNMITQEILGIIDGIVKGDGNIDRLLEAIFRIPL